MQLINAGRLMSETAINDLPEDESRPPEVASAAPTLGARLVVERESKEWTIEHVASQLNLAPRQIQALETDNYSALPGMATVRGFVRAYAKLLKIDPAPLVAMIASDQIVQTQPLERRRNLPPTPFSDNRLMAIDRRRSSSKVMLAAIVIVALAIAAVAVERTGGWPTLSQSLSSHIKDMSAGSASLQNALPAIASSVPATVSAFLPAAPAPAQESAASVSSVREAGAADAAPTMRGAESTGSKRKALPPLHTAVAAETVEKKTVLLGKNLLVLKLREDSWVEVKAGRNALISRLVKAGSTESLEITEPITLTLGNASGVDVTFRGKPLDITVDAKNNVLRLSLK